MPEFHTPPISPMAIAFDAEKLTLSPEGPTLTRRMSDLEGLFLDHDAWAAAAQGDNPVVYTVISSPVPEVDRELPQSITTIMPGDTSGELWMTKGHQHPNHQGEIYLALKGRGGLLMFDGERTEWLDMLPGTKVYKLPDDMSLRLGALSEPLTSCIRAEMSTGIPAMASRSRRPGPDHTRLTLSPSSRLG
jgi:glucose-6-phosphate isomerase